MKSLRDYLEESKHAADNPLVGDTFAINIREECLIESVVLENRNDGVVIAADDRMIELLESYGYTFEQTCMECGSSGCGCGSSEQYSDTADQDPGEYDQEGSMAKDELLTMMRSARKLIGMLDNNDNMPEWTQKKITKATDYADTAADYISSQKERGVMEGNRESNPVARAILHRIMMQHTGMLAQHGPERVMAAVDELADRVNIGPDDEIGTSDVSGYVRQVQQMLDSPREQGMAEDELDEGIIRDKLAAAALAGTMALGAGGAQARVIPGVQDGFASGFGGKPVATQMAPSTSSASATGSLNAQSAASREVAKQARNAADQFKYTNPSFAQEYKRIETTYEKIKSIVYNNKRSSSNDTDLAKRQHAESIKTLIAADMEFAKDTNALMKQYGLKEQIVAEGMVKGEYGRVLDALGLYYPRLSMEELNEPGYHKVVADKANVSVEYAARVINDFTRDNDPDEDEFDDDEQAVAESAELNTMLKYAGVPVAEDDELGEGIVDTVKQGVNKLTGYKVKVSPDDQVWIAGTTTGYFTGSNSREREQQTLEKLSNELKKLGINTSGIKYTDMHDFTGDKYPPAWFIKVVKGQAETVLDMLKNNKIPGFAAASPSLSYPSGRPPTYSHSQDGLGGNPKGESIEQDMAEAEYQGRKVALGKPMQGDVKKSKVYVKNPQGNVVKVNFGDPNMTIKKSNPARRKSFRARHNCDNPGPRTKARYWSCRAW